MTKKKSLLAALGLFSAVVLAGCTGFDSASGEVIRNPTVDDMDRYQSQWGVKPRQVKPRYRAAGPGDFMDDSPTLNSAPQTPVETPEAPAPAPQFQEPSPDPIPPPQAPSVPSPPDPATINKLR